MKQTAKNKIKDLREITGFKFDFFKLTACWNSEKDKHIMFNFWVSACDKKISLLQENAL